MLQEFQQAKKLIDQSANILLTMHERMDGDDGGALLALGEQLEKSGKQVSRVIKFGVPPTLQFLPGSKKILAEFPFSHSERSEESLSLDPVRDSSLRSEWLTKDSNYLHVKNFDLLITFGCSDKTRIGLEEIINLNIPTLNIDHHPDNTNFGTINIVDSKKSSVAELIYDFFVWNKWPINKSVATNLLTGIITDTGSFMHGNTQSSTLQAAAELMKKGAQTNNIIKHTSQSKDLPTLKAWGKAIENSYYDKQNKIIYSILTDQDLENFGKLPRSAFEGLAETLNKVPEAQMAMFIRQDGEIIKGSLRSETYKHTDVSKIAKLFGGGGHKQAAGFSLAGKLMKDEQGKWRII